MAILSALLSFVFRNLSSLVRAVLGWSVTALFGRLPQTKQTALSAALLLSLVWPVFVVGIFVPGVTAWAIAAAPVQKWIGHFATSAIGLFLALLIPLIVGGISYWVAPPRKRRSSFLVTLLAGFPLAIGYAVSCLVTAITVPLVKLGSIVRRWEDEHVFVQPKEGEYGLALRALVTACEKAKAPVAVRPVPKAMSISTNVVRWFARGSLEALVAEDPKMLKGDGIELYLYPADLLVRGTAKTTARVRACITQSLLERHAFLVEDPKAQEIQGEIQRMWDVLARHRGPAEIGAAGRDRLRAIEEKLDRTFLPFDQWVTIDRMLRRLELALGPEIALRPEEEKTMAEITEKAPAAPAVPEDVPATALVREALDEARELIKLEVALAKKEVKDELKEAKTAGVAFGAAGVLAIVALSMFALTVVLAIAPTWICALIVGIVLLVLAGVAGLVGYGSMPKKPLDRTRRRLETDMKQLKERVA